MPQDPNRLIWIDLEMTGLRPDSDRILEVAIVVTDHALDTVAQAPVFVVHQEDMGRPGRGLAADVDVPASPSPRISQPTDCRRSSAQEAIGTRS